MTWLPALLLFAEIRDPLPPIADAYRFGWTEQQCDAVVLWHQGFRNAVSKRILCSQAEEKWSTLLWSAWTESVYQDLSWGLYKSANMGLRREKLAGLRDKIGDEAYECGLLPWPFPNN